MLRRTANAAFAADMYVFPGGRVDDVDGAAELEPYCDGLDDATASEDARHRPRRAGLLGRRRAGVLRGGRAPAGPDARRQPARRLRRRAPRRPRRRAVDGGAVPAPRPRARPHGDPLRRPLGDAVRRGAAALRHPLLPGRRAARAGGRARRHARRCTACGSAPHTAIGQAEAGRADDDAADDRQPAPRRRLRRRPTPRSPSPMPSARPRASSPRSAAATPASRPASRSPATPTTTTSTDPRGPGIVSGSARTGRSDGDVGDVDRGLHGVEQAGRAAGHVGAVGRRRVAGPRRRAGRRSPGRPGRRAGVRPGLQGHRQAGVATGRHGRLQRDLPEQRHADLGGQRRAAAGAEQRVRRAVVAREVGHVLDHADDPHEAAPRHVGGPLGDLLGGQRRRRDDDHVGPRAAAGPGPSARRRCPGGMSISRSSSSPQSTSRRNCSTALVSIRPRHISAVSSSTRNPVETTLSSPSPTASVFGHDQRTVAALDPLGLHALAHAEQAGDREAPDVGVEHTDRAALAGQRDGEVDGDRALADTALAAGDGQHPRRGRDLGVAGLLAGVPPGLEHDLGALVGVHLAPRDAHVA